ncbi:MAG TPA: DNA-3-methyladenine glycosylase [Bryobacteraceae bacterium]|jgi:DNA-3-methyladenine glycosylase II|nr:DNA-3-methyladenine glycosylase [Bryobacteraceae bacterium]
MRKAIIHLKKTDPTLRGIIEKVGPCRIEFRDPVFSTLVRSIVFQQLSGKVANVIFDRLVEAASGGADLTPDAILKLKPAKLRAIGLSKQKSAYIVDLARKTREGSIVFETIHRLSDHQVIEHLTAVKGIGVWTAHMFLIFALRRADVLPTGDLGVRMAIRKAYGLPDLPKPAEIEEIARQWRPYCSFAAWYLWRSLDA